MVESMECYCRNSVFVMHSKNVFFVFISKEIFLKWGLFTFSFTYFSVTSIKEHIIEILWFENMNIACLHRSMWNSKRDNGI